ncbi:hypothetical protein FACS189497_13410 [Betaproteobacteria bacterium]|nr:hypothetical protein FACS189488_12920 [Betaproteobacteria bacterium]GHU32064.1 hypothetical protein FACS189497_13410 [Betaproteobacteria bacterium]
MSRILTGTNTYTGMTEVREGVLEIDTTGSITSTLLTLHKDTSFRDSSSGSVPTLTQLNVRGTNATYDGELSAQNATLNFYLPNGISAGSTLLNVDDDADISDSTVILFLDGGTSSALLIRPINMFKRHI